MVKCTEMILPIQYFGFSIIPIEFEVDDYDEYIKDFFFVDYCNNCKDFDVMYPKDEPCHHDWYCWHDGGECQEMEYKLGQLKEKEYWNGKLTQSEREEYFKLKNKKFELVKKKVREYRRRKQ